MLKIVPLSVKPATLINELIFPKVLSVFFTMFRHSSASFKSAFKKINEIYGGVDIQNSIGDGNSLAFDNVVVYRSFIDGHVGDAVDSNGRPLNRGNAPWTTYHVICDGNIGPTNFGENEVYREGKSAVIAATLPNGLQRGDTLGGATILVSTKVIPYPLSLIHI